METITCQICGRGGFKRIGRHVRVAHGISIQEYQRRYPGTGTVVRSRKVHRTTFGVTQVPETPSLTPPSRENIDETWVNTSSSKRILSALEVADKCGFNLLVVGPTGCGKSSTIMRAARAAGHGIRRLNLNGEVRVADFVGEKTVEIDESTGQSHIVWRDGILPAAMRAGDWLLLDELDAAPPHVLFVLQAVLERDKTLVLSANNGEVVKASPGFRIIATANTCGKGDDSGLYAGTNILNEAFLDRFEMVLEVGYPTESEEITILKKIGLPETDARSAVKMANDVRKALSQGDIYSTFSTRRLVAFAALMLHMPKSRAFDLAVANKAGEDKSALRKVFDRYFRR